MFVACFIDWENIERTVDKLGCVLDFAEFIATIKSIATKNGDRLSFISAYGDFDRGEPGKQSKLVNLGVDIKHVVTKTAHEYLKGSTDIELSLDILDTLYTLPHITSYFFVSGDGDLRHVTRRLVRHGKNIHLAGFPDHTSKYLIELADGFTSLEKYPSIMRKVTKSDMERMAKALSSDEKVIFVVRNLDSLEKRDMAFVSLAFFHKRLKERYPDESVAMSDAVTKCIDAGLMITDVVDNPHDPQNPTRTVKLDRHSEIVTRILSL